MGCNFNIQYLITWDVIYTWGVINLCMYSRGQPHPKYKANSARTSHIAVWEQDPQLLGVTGDELHDGPERGPVDRDGARSTKSKHSTSSIRGLRVSPGRFVGL